MTTTSNQTAADQLAARAAEIAAEIAENTAPVSIALTRQLLWRHASASDPFGHLESLKLRMYSAICSGDVRYATCSTIFLSAPTKFI